MKKILLSLSLLSAAGTSAAADETDRLAHEILADWWKSEICESDNLSFRGKLDFTTLFMRQKIKKENDEAVASLQGSLDFKYVAAKCDRSSFGAEIGVKTHSGVIKQKSPILRISCLFFESPCIGKIRLGYVNTSADEFCIYGDKFLVGYGGAGSGNLGIFYNESAGSLVDTGFPFDDRKALKISFLSPKIAGFSAGLSFTPDSRNATLFKTYHKRPHDDEINIERANFPGMRTAFSKNVLTGGAAYEFGDAEAWNVKISASLWIGKGKSGISDDKEVHNVRAFNLGAAVVCNKDFKFSFGYTDGGKSLRPRKYAVADIKVFDENKEYRFAFPEVGVKPGVDVGKIFSFGAAYAVSDKFTVSAGYFRSEVKFSFDEKSVADIVTLAAEYTVNRTASLYIEYNNIGTDTCARAQAYGRACGLSVTGKNQANMLMIGTKIRI
ncbi:MAG: porin [Holosporaceae bacterium]|jgi:hypothetical protein|nr:porin [Holosporaceae bacterium]